MAAFDAAGPRHAGVPGGRQYWFMAGLATAAAVLMAFSSTLHRAQPEPQPPNEFVMVPGAATLPAMESGSLVRMDVPVAELPALGLTPPPSNRTASVRSGSHRGPGRITQSRKARQLNDAPSGS